jgi:hypothetical protein
MRLDESMAEQRKAGVMAKGGGDQRETLGCQEIR